MMHRCESQILPSLKYSRPRMGNDTNSPVDWASVSLFTPSLMGRVHVLQPPPVLRCSDFSHPLPWGTCASWATFVNCYEPDQNERIEMMADQAVASLPPVKTVPDPRTALKP